MGLTVKCAPPPLDFRYVGLSPGLSPTQMALAAASASTGLAGAVLIYAGVDLPGVVTSLVAGASAALAMQQKGAFTLMTRRRARPTAMAIVPWGVLLHPHAEGAVRVLRWSGVKALSVDFIHTRDAAGSAATAWSFVTVETSRERFVGRCAGHVGLERLAAHLEAYAVESSTPVALDLEGEAPASMLPFEPVARLLLASVESFVDSGEGAGALSLRDSSYRQVSSGVATAATVEVLRGALRPAQVESDPRAFAALVAGRIGARSLVPELLRLVTAAHPVVAACAKAAALRLGAEPMHVGALDELEAFVEAEDLSLLATWSKG